MVCPIHNIYEVSPLGALWAIGSVFDPKKNHNNQMLKHLGQKACYEVTGLWHE